MGAFVELFCPKITVLIELTPCILEDLPLTSLSPNYVNHHGTVIAPTNL